MKKNLFILVSITLGLCACNLDEPLTLNDTPETTTVYHMIIPAAFDAQTKGVTFDGDGIHISTQFETTDKIYVYNVEKNAFARSADGEHPLTYLTPSASGSTCTLEGNLSFYKLNDSDEWESVVVDEGNTYNLFYQMNDPDYVYPGAGNIPRFDYSQQDGSAEGASNCDFAEATGISMTLSGNTLTVPDNVHFENLQSMFRQRLSFTKGGVAVSPRPTITKLTVGTKNKTLLEYYRPDRPDFVGNNGKYWAYKSIDFDDPVISADGDIFLSLAFYYTNEEPAEGDQLILTASDSDGNVYQCSKDVPSGGFKNSKYYHGNCEMVWLYQKGKPTVTRSDGGDIAELIPDEDGWHDIYPNEDDDPIEVTINRDSDGYRFYFNEKPAFVTLTGEGNPVTATWTGQSAFIESDEDLTINLDCNYVINNVNYDRAIECGGVLKLKTTGGTQTLTVFVDDNGDLYCGIDGAGNYDDRLSYAPDANVLAFDDSFTVTREDPELQSDGSYKWVYTVTPKLHTVTAAELGKVISANGVIYDTASDATIAGTTALAMIAYVGNVAGVCDHGLAISLTDFTQDHDPDPYTTFQLATAVTAAEATTAITGGTWRLPTEKDWQYMIWGSYVEGRSASDASGFISKLTTAGGTALVANSYWTNTSIDADTAKGLLYDGTFASFDTLTKTEYWHVRACLSF